MSGVVILVAGLAGCRDGSLDRALPAPDGGPGLTAPTALAAAAPGAPAGDAGPTSGAAPGPIGPDDADPAATSGPEGTGAPGTVPPAAAAPRPAPTAPGALDGTGAGASAPDRAGAGTDVLPLAGGGAPPAADGAGRAAAPGGPGGAVGSEEAEVRAAIATVVDLDVPFEQKAAYLEQAEALRAVHDQYVMLVRPFAGQLAVRVGDIAVDGDRATFTFDLLGGTGGVLAPGLAGEAARAGGHWQVTRHAFCATMALGGLSCPP